MFGMGTGVTSSPSSPDYVEDLVRSKPDKTDIVVLKSGSTMLLLIKVKSSID